MTKEDTKVLKSISYYVNEHLYNTDRRYMFLKMTYPHLIKFLNFNGSSNCFGTELWSESRKHNLDIKILIELEKHFKV